MKSKLLKLVCLCAISALSACTSMPDIFPEAANDLQSEVTSKPVQTAAGMGEINFQQEFLQNQVLKHQQANNATDEHTLAELKHRQKALPKNINHYVRGLMQDMAGNLQYVNATTPVAVSSFVFLDGPYDTTNLLGKQIAESFMHEIRKFNIPVLDFKTLGYIVVSPDGDFAQTRDYLELSGEMPISYIVTGTLVKHQGGYLVNARMVGMKSKAVVASAQRLIPKKVADALISSVSTTETPANMITSQVTLIQGE